MSQQDVKNETNPAEIGDLPSKNEQKKSAEKIIKDTSQKADRVRTKNVVLTEDVFGNYVMQNKKSEKIYRYTWRNHNNIEVEVITFGARIRSMKVPNKKGIAEDIVLGFNDLDGYVHYASLPFGATIGRVTNYVENRTFVIDGKQYWLSSNFGKHHFNGGFMGLDRVVFSPYVDGTKVILSHTSPDLHEGYPGSLLVRITFELSPKNEFSINMEALTTKPTLVNLSNMMYFNLAGHHAGSEEIYRHTVTINANCYTKYNDNNFPTGVIQNVVHTEFDFQIPTMLKSCMGIKPNDGYDQNFCVNRGTEQGLCFVARALHVPSGRILEIYSNQPGVNFATGNDFGSGLLKKPTTTSSSHTASLQNEDNIFELLDEIHTLLEKAPDLENTEDFDKMRQLVERLGKCRYHSERVVSKSAFPFDADDGDLSYALPEFNITHMTTALELNYLIDIKKIAGKVLPSTSRISLTMAVKRIIDLALKLDDNDQTSKLSSNEELLKSSNVVAENYAKQKEDKENEVKKNTSSEAEIDKRTDSIQLTKKIHSKNTFPTTGSYNDGRVHGKNNAVYKRHGGLCFQTQNYPNAIYHPNFPNSILRPGETYKHTIVYKLFVQRGNPAKWIKRHQPC